MSKKSRYIESNPTCPCSINSTEVLYQACCAPFHNGQFAPTPETLMKSRYSAYVLKLEDYLLNTWHPTTRPEKGLFSEAPLPQWMGLKVIQSNESDNRGQVEFIAIYKIQGKAHRLHEISQFIKEDGRWYYVDGEFPELK